MTPQDRQAVAIEGERVVAHREILPTFNELIVPNHHYYVIGIDLGRGQMIGDNVQAIAVHHPRRLERGVHEVRKTHYALTVIAADHDLRSISVLGVVLIEEREPDPAFSCGLNILDSISDKVMTDAVSIFIEEPEVLLAIRSGGSRGRHQPSRLWIWLCEVELSPRDAHDSFDDSPGNELMDAMVHLACKATTRIRPG
jgi:hypothetical protein